MNWFLLSGKRKQRYIVWQIPTLTYDIKYGEYSPFCVIATCVYKSRENRLKPGFLFEAITFGMSYLQE